MVQNDMQVCQRIRRGGLPEVFDQFAVEFADLLRRKIGVEDHEVTTAQIDRSRNKRLFHRQRKMTVATNARLVAERLLDGLSETDSNILDRVMLIDMQIALGRDLQINDRMPSKQLKHVVEEADTRLNPRVAVAVKVQLESDLGFVRLSFNLRGTRHSADTFSCGIHGWLGARRLDPSHPTLEVVIHQVQSSVEPSRRLFVRPFRH